MKSRKEDSNSGKIVPFPFTADEIQEIENIYHDDLKDDPTLLQHIKDKTYIYV